jgi:uncharacterized membrane protein
MAKVGGVDRARQKLCGHWSVVVSAGFVTGSLLRVSAVHGHVRLAGIVLATAGRSTRITGHNPITA